MSRRAPPVRIYPPVTKITAELRRPVLIPKPILRICDLSNQQEDSSAELWTEKYRPRELSQVVGNKKQLQQIHQWFTQRAQGTTPYKGLLFSGCPGTSKTTVAHCVLKYYGFRVKEFNASDSYNYKLIQEELDNIINHQQLDRQPCAVIMDEIDGIDSRSLTTLINFLNPYRGNRKVTKAQKLQYQKVRRPPIICICNHFYSKKIANLKKDCLEIVFYKPTIDELCQLLTNIATKESLNIESEAIRAIAQFSQGDYRRAIYILSYFKSLPTITSQHVYQHIDLIPQKIQDLSNFQLTARIFSQSITPQQALIYYQRDRNLIPMMIQANYLDHVYNLSQAYQISNEIILGDRLDRRIYNNQSWQLSDVHALQAIYQCNQLLPEPRKLHSKIQFPPVLSSFSHKRTTHKILHGLLEQCVFPLNTEDLQYLAFIIVELIICQDLDKVKQGLQLLTLHGLSVEHVDKLFRVNKILDNPPKYTTACSNQLKSLLN